MYSSISVEENVVVKSGGSSSDVKSLPQQDFPIPEGNN